MHLGTVITFYSYKGGVGRTFLLANVAALLARWGYRVLCVDFDLEAPGLDRYFKGGVTSEVRDGVLEMVQAVARGEAPAWRAHIEPFRGQETLGDRLHLLRAAREDASLEDRLGTLDWDALYRQHDLGHVIEAWRREWVEAYDFVLVDSRTGLTDIQGICTAQLPDILVPMFTCNEQSMEGALRVAARSQRVRANLPVERPGFLCLPVTARFDPSRDARLGDKWLGIIRERLGLGATPRADSFFAPWLHPETDRERLLELVRLDYFPEWSFGETLPVLLERPTARVISRCFALIAAFLSRRLGASHELAANPDGYLREAERLARPPADARHARLYVSYRHGDPAAQALIAALQRARVPLFIDEPAAGTGLLEWAQLLLERATHLLCVVGGAPLSMAQQVQIAAFHESRTEPPRRILFLTTPSQPLPPEFASYAVLYARGEPPEQLADRIAQALGGPAPEVEPPPPETPDPPLARYRRWLRARHQHLIPFFSGAQHRLLASVYVELGVECAEPHRGAGKAPLEEDPALRPGPTTLRALLEQRPAGRWYLVGEPGAGKTTLARHLCWTAASEEAAPEVVFLSLSRYAEARPDPLDAAVDELTQADPSAPREAVRAALGEAARAGRLWLLLDGLDEVDPAQGEATAQWLRALAKKPELRQASIVVATRPVALESRGVSGAFQRLTVRPLDDAAQARLLANLLDPESAPQVQAQLQRRAGLRAMARNPLLLTLIAVVGREAGAQGGALPGQRTRLYAEAIELLLKRGYCPEPHGMRDRTVARALLRRLSLALHEEGGESWPRAALDTAVWKLIKADPQDLGFKLTAIWGSPDGFLDDLGANSGVLGPHDGEGQPWRYLHRSLREFLTAERLVEEGRAAVDAWVARWQDAVQQREQAEQRRRPGKRETPPADTPDPNRWGEVFALLCGLWPAPWELLESLRQTSGALARRAVLSVDGLPPERALAFLLGCDGWAPEELEHLVEDWGVEIPRALDLLWAQVTPGRDTHTLGVLWERMERLGGAPPERGRFFAAAGRWPEGGPPVLEAVDLSAGSFWMGSPEGQGHGVEHPRHRVSLTRPFQLGRTVVTREQYARFDPEHACPGGPQHPVTEVDWYQARLFAAWVGGRLPTEAEWEYACRAGTEGAWSCEEAALGEHAWFDANAGGKTHPVAEKRPNPRGLYDLHGNVWEWVECRWGGYSAEPAVDPLGPAAGPRRVIRGGTCWGSADRCRSAYRGGDRPWFRYLNLGFRVAWSPSRG